MWRETITEIPKMWKDGTYSYEGKYFRMPEREVFPKPYGPAHPAMWVAAGSPPTFGEAGSLGLGAFCFSDGSPREIEPLVKQLQGRDRQRDARRRLRQRQHHGRDQHRVHGGPQQGVRGRAADMGMNYYTSLMHHWLDNIPTPHGLPEVAARSCPSRRPSRSRRRRRPATRSSVIPTTARRRSSGGSTSASTS